MSFLFDTYALIEWYVQGNANYDPYFKPSVEGHLTKLSLLEFYHQVYHRMDRETAEKYRVHLTGYAKLAELTEEIIVESAAFRSEMLEEGKEPSYTDSVNYITAKHLDARLLTGDKEFEGMENVEFVR